MKLLRKNYYPSIFFICFFFGACHVPDIPIPQPYEIEIVGEKYEWNIRYPGIDGVLHTSDDFLAKQNLHIPYDTEVKIYLKSNDFLYFLDFPDFGQTGMAIPEQVHSIHFKPHVKGTFPLRGNQMCAFTHPSLIGKVDVLKTNCFLRWVSKSSNK